MPDSSSYTLPILIEWLDAASTRAEGNQVLKQEILMRMCPRSRRFHLATAMAWLASGLATPALAVDCVLEIDQDSRAFSAAVCVMQARAHEGDDDAL